MHRVAVGGPQCISHQLFAELGIRMVDGDAVRLQFDPRGCGSFGWVGCGDRRRDRGVGSGVHGEVPRRHARFGHAQAIEWPTAVRAVSMAGEDFRRQARRTSPLWRGDGRIQAFGMMKECP
jgi:hypothetical protein